MLNKWNLMIKLNDELAFVSSAGMGSTWEGPLSSPSQASLPVHAHTHTHTHTRTDIDIAVNFPEE